MNCPCKESPANPSLVTKARHLNVEVIALQNAYGEAIGKNITTVGNSVLEAAIDNCSSCRSNYLLHYKRIQNRFAK